MIKPTLDDYRAAEEILRNKHPVYSFKGPWLERRRKTDRQAAIEAALIDILLSHDNEGSRVMLNGHFPKTTTRAQERLHYIRYHNDPEFFRTGVQESKRDHAEYAFLTERVLGIKTEEDLEYEQYSVLHMTEELLQELEKIKKQFSELKTLNWHEDRGGVFKQMASSTGLYDSDVKVHQEFSFADYYMAIKLCDGDDRYILTALLPLLREEQMDKLARDTKIMIEAYEFDDAAEKFPRIGVMLKSYEERRLAMRRERPKLEERLAQFNTASTAKGNAVRHSEVFENFAWIGMFVDPSLLDLVKRIVSERAADNDFIPTAIFSRKSPSGLRLSPR